MGTGSTTFIITLVLGTQSSNVRDGVGEIVGWVAVGDGDLEIDGLRLKDPVREGEAGLWWLKTGNDKMAALVRIGMHSTSFNKTRAKSMQHCSTTSRIGGVKMQPYFPFKQGYKS